MSSHFHKNNSPKGIGEDACEENSNESTHNGCKNKLSSQKALERGEKQAKEKKSYDNKAWYRISFWCLVVSYISCRRIKTRHRQTRKSGDSIAKEPCNISRIFVAIKKRRRRRSTIRCKAPARVKIVKCSAFMRSPTDSVCDFQLLTFFERRRFVEVFGENYHFF
jgi:hypothetical protein